MLNEGRSNILYSKYSIRFSMLDYSQLLSRFLQCHQLPWNEGMQKCANVPFIQGSSLTQAPDPLNFISVCLN